jgi:hypothetical protein
MRLAGVHGFQRDCGTENDWGFNFVKDLCRPRSNGESSYDTCVVRPSSEVVISRRSSY